MTGVLQECGCYDGEYSKEFPHTFVSVRCHDHEKVPPLPKHSLMFRDANGVPYSIRPGEGKSRFATARERRDV
jgi:hypothetical protein